MSQRAQKCQGDADCVPTGKSTRVNAAPMPAFSGSGTGTYIYGTWISRIYPPTHQGNYPTDRSGGVGTIHPPSESKDYLHYGGTCDVG